MFVFGFLARPHGLPEKAMAPHSSTLAWKIPWAEEPGRLQSMGSLIVGHHWATSLSLFTFMHWRRKWQPTPVFLPGESQGREACWAAVYGVAQSRTRLKRLSSSSMACRILVPWLGIEPRPMAVKALSPNHWTVREFPSNLQQSKHWVLTTGLSENSLVTLFFLIGGKLLYNVRSSNWFLKV